MEVFRRLVIAAVIVFFLWLIASKRLTIAKLKKLKMLVSLLLSS